MSNQLVLVAYAFTAMISIIQIIAGGMIINLGNELTDNNNSQVYSIMYAGEAGYYLATGIISIIFCATLIASLTLFPMATFLKRLGQFMLLLITFCMQAAFAVFSSINATVLSSQTSSFANFTDSKCNLYSLKYMLIAITCLTWVLIVPIMMALLNWSWGEWKETLDKELAAEPTEPSEPSVKDPLS